MWQSILKAPITIGRTRIGMKPMPEDEDDECNKQLAEYARKIQGETLLYHDKFEITKKATYEPIPEKIACEALKLLNGQKFNVEDFKPGWRKKHYRKIIDSSGQDWHIYSTYKMYFDIDEVIIICNLVITNERYSSRDKVALTKKAISKFNPTDMGMEQKVELMKYRHLVNWR